MLIFSHAFRPVVIPVRRVVREHSAVVCDRLELTDPSREKDYQNSSEKSVCNIGAVSQWRVKKCSEECVLSFSPVCALG